MTIKRPIKLLQSLTDCTLEGPITTQHALTERQCTKIRSHRLVKMNNAEKEKQTLMGLTSVSIFTAII